MKTYFIIILDRSFSMKDAAHAAITDFNEQIQAVRNRSEAQDISCSLIIFNDEVNEHYWDASPFDIPDLDDSKYLPNGGTALRDALGYAITKMSKVKLGKDDAVLVKVISDGMERDSQHYSVDSLRKLIEQRQDTGQWTISYLGCDESYLKKLSAETGIPLANFAAIDVKNASIAKKGLTRGTARMDMYFDNRARGFTSCANMYSDVSGRSADYTSE